MSESKEISALVALGMSENEARVYHAALTLGKTTVLQITRTSEMHRTTVYAVVDTLKAQGFLHEEVIGFKTKIVAEDPKVLEKLLEKKRATFHETLPNLTSLFHAHGGEHEMKFYEGKSAIRNLYDEILDELNPLDSWCAISDAERWFDVDPEFFAKFSERRAKKRLDVQLILQDSEKTQELVTFQRNFALKIKIAPKNQDFKMSLLVTSKHLLMHNLLEPTSAILIKNNVAVDMQRQVFNLMWNALPKNTTDDK